MITGLGFGFKDTGLLALVSKRTDLGLEDHCPWPRTCCPRTLMALWDNYIIDTYDHDMSDKMMFCFFYGITHQHNGVNH